MHLVLFLHLGLLGLVQFETKPCFTYVNETEITCELKTKQMANYDKTASRILTGKKCSYIYENIVYYNQKTQLFKSLFT